MTADELREALVEAWLADWALHSEVSASDRELAREYADALLPVVDAIARRRAAEELRTAAEELTDAAWMPEDVLPFLHARAHALTDREEAER